MDARGRLAFFDFRGLGEPVCAPPVADHACRVG
jgi:hypothetical protein